MDTQQPNPRIVMIESHSRPGLSHQVDLDAGTCSCEAFAFRKTCKHLTLARRLQEAAPGDGPPKP